jgi:uncharacterized protein YijF (DUF1287 family)
MLVELVFDVSQREFRAPHRDVQFRQNPGQCADVVFVTMRQKNAAHALAVFDEVRNVGNDDVDPEQFGLGKHQPRIDDQDVISPAHGHAVHAELAESAQGDDLQFSGRHSRY